MDRNWTDGYSYIQLLWNTLTLDIADIIGIHINLNLSCKCVCTCVYARAYVSVYSPVIPVKTYYCIIHPNTGCKLIGYICGLDKSTSAPSYKCKITRMPNMQTDSTTADLSMTSVLNCKHNSLDRKTKLSHNVVMS